MPLPHYSDLPQWLQLLLIVGAIATAMVAIIAFSRKVWAILNLLMTRINSLDDLPRFMSITTQTLADQDSLMSDTIATLAAQDKKIEEIHHEVKFNNGSSVKDAVHRVEVGVKGIYGRLDSADKDRDDLRHDLEITRPQPIRKRPTKTKETP